MTEQKLTGVRILVVEDDYYLAADVETALIKAGAIVLGPCSDEKGGMALADKAQIDCVLLDVNFGLGPSFRLARAMRERGVSFLFVTGYDRDALPHEFDDIQRLQKPYVERALLNAVAQLVRASPI